MAPSERDRPDADALLARIDAESARDQRGKLRIFFGYAAGVGKTYAMLQAAHKERADGRDVVVGYVEPHGRVETESLLPGLETIPTKDVSYRGVTLREFDLDAALARRPQVILVDELAHTNAPGSRHVKRWHDIDELLQAGIDVYTTLNVQHLESLNDVIAQITGVTVRETVPDGVIERADQIELIDITPTELIERLQGGKVYIPPQAERAIRHFFQPATLTALRELSLRETANRLRQDVDLARRDAAARQPWATNERLLVCVGPSPTTARLIRTAKRMADAFGAEWLAVAVSQPSASNAATLGNEQIARHLRLAEQLGAEVRTIVGDDVAATLLEYGRTRNVTKVLVGKTAQPRWKRWLKQTVVDALLEQSGPIDVYVIQGQAEDGPLRTPSFHALRRVARTREYVSTAVIVLTATLVSWLFGRCGFAEANIVMMFLLAVAIVAMRYGRGPAIAASVANVLIFDYGFVVPYYSFAISDTQYVVTFLVMLAIGLLISHLASRLRDQLHAAQEQERRTAALFRLTRQMSEMVGECILVATAGKQLQEVFDGEVVIYVRGAAGDCALSFGQETETSRHPVNPLVAHWVVDHDQPAGAGTDTLPNATAFFVPMVGSERTVGAIGVKPVHAERFADPDQRRLLATCASLVALAIERGQSVLQAHDAQLQVETERLRSSLLSSVSHDLRTPLAAIAGAASSALHARHSSDDHTRQELLQSIVDEAQRLSRLVDNLLDMTRLEGGALKLNKQWHVLEEIVGTALARTRQLLQRHPVHVDIPADLPLASLDGVLIEQAFVNLLENAARYTPPGSRLEISARQSPGKLEIVFADDGPGLPAGAETKIFEKFYRGGDGQPDSSRGVGLGLAICDAIAKAHGGAIKARNRSQGGAEFVLTLPCDSASPAVDPSLSLMRVAN